MTPRGLLRGARAAMIPNRYASTQAIQQAVRGGDFDPVDELTIFPSGDWKQAGLYHALSEAVAALAEGLELGNLDEPL